MERFRLELVRATSVGALRARRGAALGLAAVLAGAAVLATVAGADRHRTPELRVVSGGESLQRIFESGADHPEVREDLGFRRQWLGAHPLDARARAIYAALVLEAAGDREACEIASFHASRAAELNPVTLPVLRTVVQVLARCGEEAPALDHVRRIFGFDPPAAAELFARIEVFVTASAESVLPDSPEAWSAWIETLQSLGRTGQAERMIGRSHARWPDEPGLLAAAVRLESDRQRWTRVLELLPQSRTLPDGPLGSELHSRRAIARARSRDAAGACPDARKGLELAGANGYLWTLAGDALSACGAIDEARRAWNGALFRVEETNETSRLWLHVRLGRLEERAARPSAALRSWRAVLELDPEHQEARRAVRRLTHGDD